ASVNEYSARYSIVPDEFDLPEPASIRRQSARNRQGRDEALPPETSEAFRSELSRISTEAFTAYAKALDAGVARETARLVLPLSTYTEWYWKIDLYNLMHFLSLRLDAHSQEEIRQYAAILARMVEAVAPVAYEAFEDFTLGGMHLTRPEQRAVRALLGGATPEAACEAAGLPLKKPDGTVRATGEGIEFMAKLERIRGAI
ncbi:MAG: FAD-dependent thymidylate synthase, partial [Thermoplasmata archaeon]|nr:FAD-dependent thymidylate synthase [Thermoplasmata archaeon]